MKCNKNITKYTPQTCNSTFVKISCDGIKGKLINIKSRDTKWKLCLTAIMKLNLLRRQHCMKDYTEHNEWTVTDLMSRHCEQTFSFFVTMSALVNTASSNKLDANMLQAKDTSGKRNLTGFFFFFFWSWTYFFLNQSPSNSLPPSVRPHPSPATEMNIHIRFKAFKGIFQ